MRPLRLASLALLLIAPAVSAAPREFTGEIDGALYMILAPEGDWNGSLWIEAHGHRNEDAPLDASLSREHPFNAALLARGWAVATTSYRRNGFIVDDAITDVLSLRGEAAARLGAPKVVIIEGSSMGGGIATLIAEALRKDGPLAGVVAVGAALQVAVPELTQTRLTHMPRVPILFLTNQSELDGPATYVAAVRAAAIPGAVQPVLWRVLRDGHVNVNTSERLAALDAVVAWAATGISPGDRDDATIAVTAATPPATVAADGTVQAKVTDLARVYGNLFTNLKQADLAQISVKRGDAFLLKSPAGEFRVLFATTYADVAEGEWIAFPTAEGTVMIARNRANAATTAGLETGDSFSIMKAK